MVDAPTSEIVNKIRQQELVKCETCGKFVTKKTMKYTHSKTCGIIKDKVVKTKTNKILYEEEKQPVEQPHSKIIKDKPTPVVVKEVVKTFEQMRRDRYKQRVNERSTMMTNLFQHAN